MTELKLSGVINVICETGIAPWQEDIMTALTRIMMIELR